MVSAKKNARDTIFLMMGITGFFAILSSTMSKSPVLPDFAKYLQTPEGFWTGAVASASTIPGILISLPAGSLSDILGRRKVLIISTIVFASAPFLYLLITVWWQLILVRFYHGFATGMFVPVAQALIAESFPTKRGERISLFSSVTVVGRSIAPIVGGSTLLATANNYHTLYLAVGAAGVTALITAVAFLGEEKNEIKVDKVKRPSVGSIVGGWRRMAGAPRFLIVSTVEAGQYWTFGSVEFFLVKYLADKTKLDSFLQGAVMTALLFVVLLSKPFIGRVSDKVGRRAPVILGCAISAIPLFIIPFFTQFPVMLVLATVYGLGFALVTSSTPALASELVPIDTVGSAMGLLGTLMDAGQTLGPIVCSLILVTVLGYYGLFASLTIVLVMTGLLFWMSGTARESRTSREPQQALTKAHPMKGINRLLKIRPVKKREHLRFNTLTYSFFKNSNRGQALFFHDPRIISELIAIPYILAMEIMFLRRTKYFGEVNKCVISVFAVGRRPDALYISSLAVAPSYRNLGVATTMLDYSAKIAKRLGKERLELMVLKANIPALRLYKVYGFTVKEEKKWSFKMKKVVC